MERNKEALEDFAREAVVLYGADTSKMLLRRAQIADEYGDEISAKTWRQVAAIAARIIRTQQARPEAFPAPKRIAERSHKRKRKLGRQ